MLVLFNYPTLVGGAILIDPIVFLIKCGRFDQQTNISLNTIQNFLKMIFKFNRCLRFHLSLHIISQYIFDFWKPAQIVFFVTYFAHQ